MSARCVSEPVSWLLLERYHLGQLLAPERARVHAHLSACEVCSGCLKQIEADEATPLAPLPERPAAKVLPFRRRRVVTVLGALAAAAALLVLARPLLAVDTGGTGVKGVEVAFSLVRDDGQRVDGPEGVFRAGDAFEALVTCAPPSRAQFDLVVWDARGASFPLDVPVGFACGNSRRLPGAFRLTGAEPQQVCLVWGEVRPDRGVLSAGVPSGPHALCKQLRPAP